MTQLHLFQTVGDFDYHHLFLSSTLPSPTMSIAIAILALLLLGALSALIFQRKNYTRLFKKINRLFEDAINNKITTVSYDESVASALGDKILHYINTNKQQLATIEKDRDTIKTLISDISHQTKTPIANILLYSGLLLEQEDLKDSATQMVEDIQRQSEKLKFLLDALVKISRLETGIINIEKNIQAVKPLISAVVSEAYPALSEKEINLSVAIEENIYADFDGKWTKEALFNFLDNAIKYSPTGSRITITGTAYEMFVRIDIADGGVGIPEEEHAKIFRRFYRSPRTREQEGIGVGLFLAREIIMLQGGYIKMASELGKGSVFSIFLLK